MRTLIVADADPLISLAQAGALDALLRPGMPVVIPDMVRFEVVRDPNRPGASAFARWLRDQEPGAVRVESTEVFEEFEVLRSLNRVPGLKNRAEMAAAEVLGRVLSAPESRATLLGDDTFTKRNLLTDLPSQVNVVTISEFLNAQK